MSSYASVLTAAAVAAGCLGAALRLLPRLRVFDDADERSSHAGRAIRGLGVALLVGWLAAVSYFDPDIALSALLIAPVAIGVIGFSDDLAAGIPPQIRFAAVGLIGLVVAWELTSNARAELFWIPLGGLWVLAFVNAFNFMDGIDGISATTAVVAGTAYAVVADRSSIDALVEVGLVVAVLGATFGVVNILGTGHFLGDAGSYFFGAVLAALALETYFISGSAAAAAGPLVLYTVDTGWAIVGKVRDGLPIWQPHRRHIYQRLIDEAGWSHGRTSLLVLVFTGATALVGVLASGGPERLGQVPAFALLVMLAVLYLSTPAALRWAERPVDGGIATARYGHARAFHRE